MRIVTCVPILGLYAATLFSQTPPDCKDTANRTVIDRAAPAIAPAVTPLQVTRPLPECALCANLSLTEPERHGGATRVPMYRAIRALGSRIFPASSPGHNRQTNAVLLNRFWRGSDFRFALGSVAPPTPPCAAPGGPSR